MPQMAPMNWLTLMIMFSIIMMMFNSMNFFSFFKKATKSMKLKNKTKKSWKW